MPLINCETNIILTWLGLRILLLSNPAANQGTTFAITDTNLYAPVITLSTRNNVKLLK